MACSKDCSDDGSFAKMVTRGKQLVASQLSPAVAAVEICI